jgi:hypothetical protein
LNSEIEVVEIFGFPRKRTMSIAKSPLKFKRLVLTGAVTVITIAGTLYGAGLKTEQEVAQVCAFRPVSLTRLTKTT